MRPPWDEILRIIREEDPPKPSTRLLDSKDTLPSISAQRHTEPAKLTRLVRGELDWIVMKALEKDRSRRYETANGFAMDVQRYLADEPVIACPPSSGYRFRKFARRNKTGLAVAGLVLFFLVLIAVGSLVAALQLDQTNTQLTNRNQELTKARQVADARLYQADLDRARAHRWSRRLGQRFVALEALSEAVSLLPSLAISEEERASRRRSLRDEAIACLTLVDVQLEREFVFNPPVDHNVVCDRQMTRYAVSDQKGNIRVHRLADDEVVLRFPTFGQVSYQMEFSPNGRYLLAKYDQNSQAQLHIFDLQDGRTVWTTMDLPQGPSFAFSHDSRLIAVGQTDHSIRLIELQTALEKQRLPAAEAAPGTLCFNPDGTMLAAASHTHFAGPVIVWDLERSDVAHRLADANGGVSVAWSPDGQLLAVGCADYCAYVWTAGQTGEPLAVCRGHQAEVIEICFSNGGDLLATHSWDGTTRLWDPRTGRERLSVPGRGAARLRFGPNDRRVALARGVWQLAAGHECRTIPAHEQLGKDKGPQHVVVSPDDRLIASCDKDGLRLWDLANRSEIAHLPIGHVRSAHFADSKTLITSGEHGLDRWPIRHKADQAGRLIIGPSQSLVSQWSSAHGSLSRDGRTLAVMSGSNVELLDLEANSPRRHLSGRAGLTSVALSPDGRWAAAASWHGRWRPSLGCGHRPCRQGLADGVPEHQCRLQPRRALAGHRDRSGIPILARGKLEGWQGHSPSSGRRQHARLRRLYPRRPTAGHRHDEKRDPTGQSGDGRAAGHARVARPHAGLAFAVLQQRWQHAHRCHPQPPLADLGPRGDPPAIAGDGPRLGGTACGTAAGQRGRTGASVSRGGLASRDHQVRHAARPDPERRGRRTAGRGEAR